MATDKDAPHVTRAPQPSHSERPWLNVCVVVPRDLVPLIDAAAAELDLNRSAWVRAAISEKLGREVPYPSDKKRKGRGWKRHGEGETGT